MSRMGSASSRPTSVHSLGCTFLSRIYDSGNTAIEKRAIFYKRLLALLGFTRKREGGFAPNDVRTHAINTSIGGRRVRTIPSLAY